MRIVNVVATAALGQEVDLEELGKLREFLHDSDIYGGRVAYLKSNVMGKVSIFASGKMIGVGTKSENQAISQLECARDLLVKKGFIKPVILKPKIVNIVVTADFGLNIDLEKSLKNR